MLNQIKNISIQISFLIFSFFIFFSTAFAGSFTWNALATGTPTDGDGVWNLTTTNWNLSGTNNFVWNNANNDTAIIGVGGTTPGSINLTAAISAAGIIFNAPAGYTLSGNNLTLTTPATINAAVAATISNNIDGTVGLTKTGAGVLTLSGNNIYTGTTTITAGTIQIGSGGATGRFGTGNIVNNAGISILKNAATTLTNVITGTGGITIANAQTLTLSANNNFTGSVAMVNGSVLTFPTGTTQTIGNIINSGSNVGHTINVNGTLNFAGNGYIELSNKNQGNFGSATATLNVNAGADLNVYQIYTARNSGCCTSTLSVSNININDATVRLTSMSGSGWTGGGNSFNTTINFNGGTIRPRDETSDFTITAFGGNTFNLAAGKTNIFYVPPNRKGTISYDVKSTGGFTKTGTGTLIFGPASGTNAYSGNSLINEGRFGGTGSDANSNFTFASGTSIMAGTGAGNTNTLTTGNLTFTDSTNQIIVNTNSVNLTNKVIAKVVNLNGVTVKLNGGVQPGTYTILTGTSLTGTANFDTTGLCNSSMIQTTTSLQLVIGASCSSPGGVSGQIFWLKADSGTSTTVNNAAVSSWLGNTLVPVSYNQATPAAQPIYLSQVSDRSNFNPVIKFSGAQSLSGTSTFGTATRNIANMFAVSSTTALTAGAQFSEVLGTGSGVYLYAGYTAGITHWQGAATSAVQSPWGGNLTYPNLWTGFNGNTTETNKRQLRRDGLQLIGNTTAVVNYIGNNSNTIIGNGTNGTTGEMIFYDINLTATDRSKIESYLAIKWGLSLDQSTPQDYIGSDGRTVWNSSFAGLYKNNITIIGRDDGSQLLQKQSKSASTDGIVAFSKGSLAADNLSNQNGFENNYDFVGIADNGGGSNYFTSAGAPSGRQILNTVWQVQEIGTNYSEYGLSVPDNSSTSTKKLPLMTTSSLSVLVDNDTDFTNGYSEYPMTLNGTNWEISGIDLNQGNYFTFATQPNLKGPGGVSSANTLWLKADGSITDPGTNVTSWKNDSTSYTPQQEMIVVKTSDPDLQDNLFNFNPGVNFDGGDYI